MLIAHCFVVAKPAQKIIDDVLFKGTTAQIRALNKQARKELRTQQRAEWKAKNDKAQN